MSAHVAPDYIYLDYAATAPLCEEAACAMAPYFEPGRVNLAVGGNANSLHTPGRAAFEAMEGARRRIARALGASRPDEIVFTSGATEADNAALVGISQAAAAARNVKVPHIITSAIEHDAVLHPAKRLASSGCRVTYLQPDSRGFVRPEALESVIDEDTVLVSVQMANSEVGSIQPIERLCAIAHEHGALFHTDAVQALGKTPLNVRDFGVDAASFSAHKIGGPKGVGALYLKARTPFSATMLGGGQENGRRSGTQNVAGIVGFAAACEAAVGSVAEERVRLGALRDRLYEGLCAFDALDATVEVAPASEEFLPNIVHVLARGFESETLILRLDMKGIGVSGGSACSSHSLEPSHVLKSMGVKDDRAYGALRISMGRYTTEDDVEAVLTAMQGVLDW